MQTEYAMENRNLATNKLRHDLDVGGLIMSNYVLLLVESSLEGQLSMDQKHPMVSV